MVDRLLSEDLLRALDAFIAEQHPGLGRYDALRLAFSDWAARSGYLDTPLDQTDIFPKGARDVVTPQDHIAAGGMLDRFIQGGRSEDGRQAGDDMPRSA